MRKLAARELGALCTLPTELKPRIHQMSNGWYMLRAPAWTTLRSNNRVYVSARYDTVLQHWADDIMKFHNDSFETLVYTARREYRQLQDLLLRTGRP